ncbi:MAG TPA: type II toxin-antitoxin system PemK/MazF family toxin [Xanthobacteraceae bacterium]
MEARLRRGEIWTASGGPDYTGKPRPFIIVQDERLGIVNSVSVCGFTTDPAEAPMHRVLIMPTDLNRLQAASHIMVDKVTTIPATKLGYRIGRLDDEDLPRLNRALLIHFGLTG